MCDEVLDGWQADGIEWVRFELPDMHGTSRPRRSRSGTPPLRRARPEHVRRRQRARLALRRGRGHALQRGTQVRRPAAVPRPGRRRSSRGPSTPRRFICDAQWHDGSTLEATPRQRVPAGARAVPVDGLRAADRLRVRVLPAGRRDQQPLFDGYHIFNTVRNDWVPTIGRILELMPQARRRHHHVELRVRRGPVGDQLRARARGLAGPGQRVHVQERREGDRAARTATWRRS